MCSIYTRFCFPCKYFVSISQQICQGETQHRNASVGCYRGSAFLSFVLLIAAASKCPFFISHLVVWGVTVKASHAFLPHAPSSLPSLTARIVFLGGGCTLFNAHSSRRQWPTWPFNQLWKKAALIWCWDPLLPLAESQGTLCGSRRGGGSHNISTPICLSHIAPHPCLPIPS